MAAINELSISRGKRGFLIKWEEALPIAYGQGQLNATSFQQLSTVWAAYASLEEVLDAVRTAFTANGKKK